MVTNGPYGMPGVKPVPGVMCKTSALLTIPFLWSLLLNFLKLFLVTTPSGSVQGLILFSTQESFMAEFGRPCALRARHVLYQLYSYLWPYTLIHKCFLQIGISCIRCTTLKIGTLT